MMARTDAQTDALAGAEPRRRFAEIAQGRIGREQLRGRIAEIQLGLAVRPEDEHPERALGADPVSQQQQRRARGPVQVRRARQRGLLTRTDRGAADATVAPRPA